MTHALRVSLALLLVAVGAAGCRDGSPEERLAELTAEAERLYAEGELEAAAEAYEAAVSFARVAGDEQAARSLTAQRAVPLKLLGRLDEAREILLPVLERSRAAGDRRTEGLALGNLARVEALAGRHEVAIDRMDEVVELARDIGDARLETLTLEQTAASVLARGHVEEALGRIEDALEASARCDPEDARTEPLRRLKAWALVRRGDDEGAAALWDTTSASASAVARQARQLAGLGLHEAAAARAWEAAQLFDEEQDRPEAERARVRDQALVLSLGEWLAAGRLSVCEERLAAVLDAAGERSDPVARAPFDVVAARLSLARGRPDEAAARLADVRALTGDTGDLETVGWLLAVALGRAGRTGEALAVLDDPHPSLAGQLLRGWLLRETGTASALARESLDRLAAADPDPAEDGVARLRRLVPDLPSLAWLALHHGLADADRLRASGRGEVAGRVVADAVAAALRWQLRESWWSVHGRWPAAADVAAGDRRIAAWVDGDVLPGEAVLAVLPGEPLSYLVICQSELGATTFGRPPEADLRRRADAVLETLRGGSLTAVAEAARELHAVLVDAPVREDLEGRVTLSWILPEFLAAIPPAMLVTEPVVPGRPVRWLALERVVRLLPHAPLEAPDPGADRSGWVHLAAPAVDLSGSRLLADVMVERYGTSGLASGPPRRGPDALVLTGEAVRAGTLRERAAEAAVLELSVPGLGGGRTGGLLLSPDPGAAFGDERVGILPWHRLVEFDWPPLVVLDRTRFDPHLDDGMVHAAACLAQGGASWTVLARWPLADPLRELLLGAFADGIRAGLAPPEALAAAQRRHVEGAVELGRRELEHPRQWAALVCAGGP